MSGLAALESALIAHGYGQSLQRDEPLARHTSFNVGGPADLFLTVHSLDRLVEAVEMAWSFGLPVRVIGEGTNILVADAGIRGLVIANRCERYAIDRDGLLEVESGTPLRQVARWTVEQGWGGLEWASGIPGTVGGAVVGNAGAYGGYISDVFQTARVLRRGLGEQTFSSEEMEFGYRTSTLKRSMPFSTVVLSARLQLAGGDREALCERVALISGQRQARTPQGQCAGSMFKRTDRYPAGFLIDQAGLKGLQIGDAQVSPKHANFLMNLGQATASDVRALITEVQRRVWLTFAEHLEPEVEFVGEWEPPLKERWGMGER